VPTLLGSNKDEGTAFATILPTDVSGFLAQSTIGLARCFDVIDVARCFDVIDVARCFDVLARHAAIGSIVSVTISYTCSSILFGIQNLGTLADLYPTATYASPWWCLADILGDWAFTCPTKQMVCS
jgi:hypothetical protein